MSREHGTQKDDEDNSSSSPLPTPQVDEDYLQSFSPTNRARSNSMGVNTHADILNYVAKQQSKAIASKELVRHLLFTVVSLIWLCVHTILNQSLCWCEMYIFLTIVALQRLVSSSIYLLYSQYCFHKAYILCQPLPNTACLCRSVFYSYVMNQSLMAAFVDQEIDMDLQTFAKTYPDVHQPEELRDVCTSQSLFCFTLVYICLSLN